ncbi:MULTISPECIES: UDP-N-acetylmuramoyl-L-alanine--D-glutamate ligase [unclassified Frondihabitans]|uniref:UDP-N-acetylmuramoyl-L-alanine--D-glutamate ligase n=1 Tax=unclassified Frondihabitans TaxID=2626248 RepID=UPI000F4EB6D2|nr:MULTISPECIES: UDP-N-acetylmuramoyl-L-alanine--D-glutamate ligase [unclassified Frondihabitans]RPE74926.1 UDP-N-acetylmuramoylalanine--D-glutamate ligase [Frondihabitans sp. PhB153]RPF04170.1 UDP-N-acetylmuramoylalanine--D-glutamate ligase [Frondihabitans sp. PhB161]
MPDTTPLADRLAALTSWHADWKGLRVAVLGLGVSGFSSADTLAELGAEVLVVAPDDSSDQAQLLPVIGVRLVTQKDLSDPPHELIEFDADVVVVSPGFAPHHPLVVWALSSRAAVWGDVELAWRVRDKVLGAKTGRPADWVLITGTNGKTTTTQLTAAMIAADGRSVAACGNIGLPVLDAVREPEGFDVFAVELSSHQLHYLPIEGPGALHPIASVCLNIEDDHLEWHGGADAYRRAKGRVYANTVVACVYNRADVATRLLVQEADVEDGCRAIGFGLSTPPVGDFGVVEDLLVDRAFLDDRAHRALELTTLDTLASSGLGADHLVEDVLAAAALARALGVAPDAIHLAAAAFRADHHRSEVVASRSGITWIDDSKATNPHAAKASLSAAGSVVWIVGGLFKGVDVAPLVDKVSRAVKAAVLIGADRQILREAFARHAPGIPVFEVDEPDTERVMPRAVTFAASVAESGDTVLLAPAAASFDQFADYGARGEAFARAVHDHLAGDTDGDHPIQPPAPTAG